jgi:hypothetical protein
MLQLLGQTQHFVIKYETTLAHAERRAASLLANCEKKYQTLYQLFGYTEDILTASKTGPYEIHVVTDTQAHNFGYNPKGGLITVDSLEGATDQALGDDGALALFVAEFAEIIMSYQNYGGSTKGWDPNASNGEGLSRFCASLLHPDSYYTVLKPGSDVNTWLQSTARNDWISKNELKDSDDDSYGCSVLFLYYLYAQLGYNVVDILKASLPTLEEVFQSLTKRSGGYAEFTGFLSKYLPIGSTPQQYTDNPFPFAAAQARGVWLGFSESRSAASTILSQGTAVARPYPTCPPKSYRYTVLGTPEQIQCIANVFGFGNPSFAWTIAGHPVDPNFGGVVIAELSVLVDDPANPSAPKQTTQNVTIIYSLISDSSTYKGRSDTLAFRVVGEPGHVVIPVEVTVSEAPAANAGSNSASITVVADQQTIQYEPQFYVDQRRCFETFVGHVRDLGLRYEHIVRPLGRIGPDPGPLVQLAIDDLRIIQETLNHLERREPSAAAALNKLAAQAYGLPSGFLGSVARPKPVSGEHQPE